MTPQQWVDFCTDIKDQMGQFVWPHVTPLSVAVSENRGIALGTGNYVTLHSGTYVLTNCHVLQEAKGSRVGHLPGPTDDYLRLEHHYQLEDWPVDLALTRVGNEWKRATAKSLQSSHFDDRYSPVPKELLFFLGFPGSTATRRENITELNIRYSLFGMLRSAGIPMVTQQRPDQTAALRNYEPRFHVLVEYPAKALKSSRGALEDLPNPAGMSGSLLWDTKAVACLNGGKRWSPELARICGLVWAEEHKPGPDVILATKVEHLRPVLLRFLREEKAFFRWHDRGRRRDTRLEDWVNAESSIPIL